MHILEGISEANDDGDLPPMEDRFSIEISHYMKVRNQHPNH